MFIFKDEGIHLSFSLVYFVSEKCNTLREDVITNSLILLYTSEVSSFYCNNMWQVVSLKEKTFFYSIRQTDSLKLQFNSYLYGYSSAQC